jgi:hypothetical protein
MDIGASSGGDYETSLARTNDAVLRALAATTWRHSWWRHSWWRHS